MKLWYDDKKIPTWVEVLAVIFFAILLSGIFSLGLLGISIGSLITSLF